MDPRTAPSDRRDPGTPDVPPPPPPGSAESHRSADAAHDRQGGTRDAPNGDARTGTAPNGDVRTGNARTGNVRTGNARTEDAPDGHGPTGGRTSGDGQSGPDRAGEDGEDDAMAARARNTAGSSATSVRRLPREAWPAVAQRVQLQVKDNNVSLLAAGVAFRALLAVVPALVAGLTMWGLIGDPETITDQISEFAGMLPEEGGSFVEQQLSQLTGAASGTLSIALAVSLLAALWSASSGVLGLVDGCGAAYGEADTRSFVRRRGLGLLLTAAALVFLMVSLVALTVVPALLDGLDLGAGATLAIQIGRWPALALLTIVGLAVLYRVGPDRRSPRLRWVTWGAIVATVVWLLGSAAFSVYVTNFGDLDETYGSLAGIVIVMLWVFLSAFAVLLGATVNAELERQTAVDTTVGPERPLGERGARAADTTPRQYDSPQL